MEQNIIEILAWMEQAACKGADPRLFFPSKHHIDGEQDGPGAYRQARIICDGCSVVNECLQYALTHFNTHDEDHGMWGGKSPKERRKIRRLKTIYVGSH